MKKLLLSFMLFIPVLLMAQHPGGGFSGSDYVLMGETQIVLKDGSSVTCKDNVDGVKIGKTNIDYKDVDHILLVKTKLSGFDAHNGSIYKYITVKGKPKLVCLIVETPNLSFYQERPKMTGGGNPTSASYRPDGQKSNFFMIKDASEEADKVDFGKNYSNLDKIFPNCPRFVEYQKDKELRKELTFSKICEIYNDCLK